MGLKVESTMLSHATKSRPSYSCLSTYARSTTVWSWSTSGKGSVMFWQLILATLFALVLDNAWPECVSLGTYNQPSKYRGIAILAFHRVQDWYLTRLFEQAQCKHWTTRVHILFFRPREERKKASFRVFLSRVQLYVRRLKSPRPNRCLLRSAKVDNIPGSLNHWVKSQTYWWAR